MLSRSYQNLKAIRFDGELLPNWAQLLDLASMICPVSEETRRWFSTFTNSNGVDDARMILAHCEVLRSKLEDHREFVLTALQRSPDDKQVSQIYAAWIYTLDTMIQQASDSQTCSWQLESAESTDDHDSGGGEISLRRV
jgi:hypothetical protein